MRCLALLSWLAIAACGAEPTPATPVTKPAPAATRVEPVPAIEPVNATLARPQLSVLDAGTQPRRSLRYTPVLGEQTLSLTLASSLALDLGIAAIPPTQVPALRLDFSVQTRRRDGESFVVVLAPTTVAVVEGEGSAALAAGMAPTIASLEQLRAELVIGADGALLETSLALPPTPGASGPSETERLQNAFAQLFVPLPTDPIGPGARWSVTQTLPFAGSRITQTNTYLLRELDGERLTVELTLEQGPAPADLGTARPDTSAAMRTTLDALRTEGRGTMRLDLRRVGPVSATSTSHSDVTQTIERDGQRQQVSMSLDLSLEAQADPPPAR